KDNPLTARVFVNRVWQYHFGKALVGTPSNFGSLGDRPTHPELLDWLAVSFMENGWSVKKLHREIMLSAVYQLSCDSNDKNFTSERRVETTVPQQQLYVLNSPFVIETAKAFAARLQKEASSDTERVQRAFSLAYGRPATTEESQLFEQFLQGKDADSSANRLT